MRHALLLMMLGWPARAQDARLEWLVTAKGPVKRPALLGAFDPKWRQEHDLVRLYGWHGDKAVPVLEDNAESYDQVAAAVRLLTASGDDELRPMNAPVLTVFRDEAQKKLQQAGAGEVKTPVSIEEGAAAAKKLSELFIANGTEVQLRLLSNTPFPGPKVLEVLPQGESGFEVKTFMAPGRLDAEALKSGKLNPTSLVYEMYVPHVARPQEVFARMAKAHALAVRKLGGVVEVQVETFGKRAKGTVESARKRVAAVDKELTKAGFPPGAPATLSLFRLP